MIVKLELPPGSVWSEQQLSEMIGIGRTPVREALQRLQAQFLVKVLPRLGAQITEINVSEQMLLLEVRRVLERLIAENAARRATREEKDHLLKMADKLEAMAQGGDALPVLRYDAEVKRHVAACARNAYASRAIEAAHAISRRFYFLHHRERQDLPLATRLHTDVIRAIARGQPAEAAASADRLMDYVEEMTRATIGHRG